MKYILPQQAQAKLDQDIKDAHARYDKRIAEFTKVQRAALVRKDPDERAITATHRRKEALDHRNEGLTFREIGKKLNVSAEHARILVLYAKSEPTINTFTTRARNVIVNQVNKWNFTLDDVSNIPLSDLESAPNCGEKTIIEIMEVLSRHGLSLKS
jgi:multidrug efflux pump subunit AcrA (membrane-fusion protein)